MTTNVARPRRPGRAFLTAPLRRRTWAEAAYALLGLPLGVMGFGYVAVTLYAGVLTVVVFGLPLTAAAGLGARWLGSWMRRLANRMLGTSVPAPAPFRPRPGLVGWTRSGLTDATAWRARLYLLLKLPVGVCGFATALALWVYGLGGLTYPVWRPFPPVYLDTWWSVVVTAVAGLILLLLAPWAVRGMLAVDRLLVSVLLGPTGSAERVRELEVTRARAVDDSAAALRHIERDLHDGTQARLVALAMKVGLAREKLDEDGDVDKVRLLLDSAHSTAKEAIAELRDLVRGIHPPVLDLGLDRALATLAAQSPVPVELRVATARRPTPAIETIAYFCVAELLTNVAKQGGARHATVEVHTTRDLLRLQVSDDGRGGARVGAGSGLSGLDNRVRTVDGRLTVDSPDGGPTVITVDLPVRS